MTPTEALVSWFVLAPGLGIVSLCVYLWLESSTTRRRWKATQRYEADNAEHS